MRSLEWWRSDDAYPCRCADYLYSMLRAGLHRKTAELKGLKATGPSWPAILGYDPSIDAPVWVEVTAPIHIRDYARAYPDRVNPAALAVLEVMKHESRSGPQMLGHDGYFWSHNGDGNWKFVANLEPQSTSQVPAT